MIFQSVLLLPVIHAGLLALGFYRLQRLMERLSPLKSMGSLASEPAILKQAHGLARIVAIAAEHGVYQATCLRRSLLVWWYLRRSGISGQVCFGVRTFHGKLEAHAWVEYQGMVVNDSASVHEDFQALHESFPSTQSGL